MPIRDNTGKTQTQRHRQPIGTTVEEGEERRGKWEEWEVWVKEEWVEKDVRVEWKRRKKREKGGKGRGRWDIYME
jgi:hypothetical protein